MTPMIRFISPIYVLDLVHVYSSKTEYIFCFFSWVFLCDPITYVLIYCKPISFIVIVILNRSIWKKKFHSILFFHSSFNSLMFCVLSPTLSHSLHNILSIRPHFKSQYSNQMFNSIFYQGYCFLLHILLKI